ncbi:hypothetical protein OHB05_29320 [Streptomyces sp. NBC_00638]|uniref:hypothetical protein n=1 Tax=Streptomyces sp. NBC_00638 TaxID=2975794 RepID=UPI00224F889D|nr:hypothetical protein [Streptomyces sp. NBC_00638]MCX5006691.1 hypothetical protein [Streptomyces sp. NBC_00638]
MAREQNTDVGDPETSFLFFAFAFAVIADPVSSVAYAIEAALRALRGDLALLLPTMSLIIGLVVVVTANYSQLVRRFPKGGARLPRAQPVVTGRNPQSPRTLPTGTRRSREHSWPLSIHVCRGARRTSGWPGGTRMSSCRPPTSRARWRPMISTGWRGRRT